MSRPEAAPLQRARNDPGQYDDLAGDWRDPRGAFAALHWLARARAALIPPPPRTGTGLLVDVGCGGGLLAPHVRGYRHVGVDLIRSALGAAKRRGVTPLQGDAAALPLGDGVADVVVAGELFEHVVDLEAVVAEVARVLRPGGVLLADTIADTLRARLALVVIGEHLPGGPPRRIHDPALFVAPPKLRSLFSRHGVRLRFRGLRPSARDYLGFLIRTTDEVRMVPTASLASLYQAWGRKEP